VQRNVTAEAKFTFADPTKAKIAGGVVTPVADGETKLKVEWNGQSAEVPVKWSRRRSIRRFPSVAM